MCRPPSRSQWGFKFSPRQVAWVVIWMIAFGSPICPGRSSTMAAAAEGIHGDSHHVAHPRPTEKQIKAYLGLAALGGIVIVGIALAALVILWAGRLRRQLRRPLPEAGHPDRDFWFLKPPKPTVTTSALPDAHLPPHVPPPGEPPQS